MRSKHFCPYQILASLFCPSCVKYLIKITLSDELLPNTSTNVNPHHHYLSAQPLCTHSAIGTPHTHVSVIIFVLQRFFF